METLISTLIVLLRAAFLTRTGLALENAALRQQLTLYQRNQKRPRIRAGDRVFWVLLRRLWSGWDRALLIVKPETVISWHRQGFKLIWRRRCRGRRAGRPRIPRQHRLFIRRMSADHPEWGEDRIAEELAAKFGIHHSGSTIRRYMIVRRPPRARQTWRTFIRNHAQQVWACDFLTQYTAFFAVVYVFVVMEVGSRRIVHVNVTTNPSLAWVKQQIREASASNDLPRFLVHDNDGIFGQFGRAVTVEEKDRRRSYRCRSIDGSIMSWESRACRSPMARRTPHPTSNDSCGPCGRRPWTTSSSSTRTTSDESSTSTSATTTARGRHRRSTGSQIPIRS